MSFQTSNEFSDSPTASKLYGNLRTVTSYNLIFDTHQIHPANLLCIYEVFRQYDDACERQACTEP